MNLYQVLYIDRDMDLMYLNFGAVFLRPGDRDRLAVTPTVGCFAEPSDAIARLCWTGLAAQRQLAPTILTSVEDFLDLVLVF